ncbi:MAG: hypothetical protein U5L96_02595 [Owenweeksia sp.]|nr:hypothetical protein [Owenweeksia sp.]
MNILNNAVYAVTHKKFHAGEKPTLTLKTRQDGENVKVHLQV